MGVVSVLLGMGDRGVWGDRGCEVGVWEGR